MQQIQATMLAMQQMEEQAQQTGTSPPQPRAAAPAPTARGGPAQPGGTICGMDTRVLVRPLNVGLSGCRFPELMLAWFIPTFVQ